MHSSFLYILDRIQHKRIRADELLVLRRRFEVIVAEAYSEEELRVAKEMQALREEISSSLAKKAIHACSMCARRCSFLESPWSGGFCCSGRTEHIFSDDELAGLAASGTRLFDFQAPRTEHAGCAFRGPLGCSLPTSHRPNLCVSYMCRDLSRELAQRGDFLDIEEQCTQIQTLLTTFSALRKSRHEREAESTLLSLLCS